MTNDRVIVRPEVNKRELAQAIELVLLGAAEGCGPM